MTVATNALLEGRTARTALIATDGFTDVIELGRQDRPHLYRLCASAPAPLVPAELRFAAPERIGPGRPAARARSRAAPRAGRGDRARRARRRSPSRCCTPTPIPRTSALLGELLAELLPDVHVSLSSELVGTFREYERTATTVLDAALSPLLATYLRRLCRRGRARAACPSRRSCSPRAASPTRGRAAAHAALTVLSGPAGGVGGALLLAELAGERERAVLRHGRHLLRRLPDRRLRGRRDRRARDRRAAAGAAGARHPHRRRGRRLDRLARRRRRAARGAGLGGRGPGPACYGRGGEQPTVTDANLLLGRLLEDAPLAGGLALDRDAAERAVVAARAASSAWTPLACAEGIVRVAEAEMLGALRVMTVERGIDPRGFALMPFGGAGPLHAAALARELGIARILCPRASGVLCALGLAAAAPRRDVSRTVMLARRVADRRAPVAASATPSSPRPAPRSRGRPARMRVRHELRYRGQSFELAVEETRRRRDPGVPCARPSRGAHEQRYGYRDDARRGRAGQRCASPCWGPRPRCAPLGAGRARPRAERRARSSSPASRSRRPSSAASSRPARPFAGRRCARCPRPRCSSRPAGRARSTRTGPSSCRGGA